MQGLLWGPLPGHPVLTHWRLPSCSRRLRRHSGSHIKTSPCYEQGIRSLVGIIYICICMYVCMYTVSSRAMGDVLAQVGARSRSRISRSATNAQQSRDGYASSEGVLGAQHEHCGSSRTVSGSQPDGIVQILPRPAAVLESLATFRPIPSARGPWIHFRGASDRHSAARSLWPLRQIGRAHV